MAQSHPSVTLGDVLELVKELSPLDQVRLIEHVASAIESALAAPVAGARTPLLGLVKDLGPAPSEEEIDDVRRDAWSSFGRDVG